MVGIYEAIEDVGANAGTPAAVEALKSACYGRDLDTDAKVALTGAAFPYPLDEFQLQAITALAQNQSTVVSAPTGSGKTVIGEAAVYLALANGLRAFYTTPLKALSNQKFNDFKAQFGEERVGLLTGDVSVNREAEVVVMTTEVYRNMLYASESGNEISGVQPSILDGVFAVVMDEFHFMNDRERGTVWEESVIISPRKTLLVALSATMSNVEEVSEWFDEVHGPTQLVVSSHRPVPLDFGFCNRDGLFSLFSTRQGTFREKMINPKACAVEVVKQAAMRVEHRGIAGDWDDDMRKGKKPRRGNRRASPAEIAKEIDYMLEEGLRRGKMLKIIANARPAPREVPSYGFLVRCLKKRSMLPVIVFVFSRNGCDTAASMVAEGDSVDLLTSEEAQDIDRRLSEFERAHPGIIGEDKLRIVRRGIASHHAGLLPLWKAVVEELFQGGLIKVIFATETLAAGINMPARTTAITALSKRAGSEGLVELTTSEVLQMAGRAGRRGKDKRGTCVFVRSQFEGAETAYTRINQPVDELNSTFAASYGMVLNLLQRKDLATAKQLVERSFGGFLLRRKRKARYLQNKQLSAGEQFVEAKKVLESTDLDKVADLARKIDRLRTEQRVLKKLAQLALLDRMEEQEEILPFAPSGTPTVVVRADKDISALSVQKSAMEASLGMANAGAGVEDVIEYAVLVGGYEDGAMTMRCILTRDGHLRLVANEHIVHLEIEAEPLGINEEILREYAEQQDPHRPRPLARRPSSSGVASRALELTRQRLWIAPQKGAGASSHSKRGPPQKQRQDSTSLMHQTASVKW